MECPNVIVVVVDTLREDHARLLEDELRRIGFISYKNVIAPASWTIPSHASIFTGLYPIFHGAHETKNKKGAEVTLKKNKNILSLQLSELGYTTYLLSANPYIRPAFGFSGFDYFYDSPYMHSFPLLSSKEIKNIVKLKQKYSPKTKFEFVRALISSNQYRLLIKAGLGYFLNKPYRYAYSMIKGWPNDKGAKNFIKILKRLKLQMISKLFIFINLMEVHEPYFINDKFNFIENLKTKKFNQKYVQQWKKKYSEQVSYISRKIVEIMKILKEKKIFNNSLIVVTSDHGQLLGEFGRIGHGTFLYDELLKVPLLIKYPEGYKIEHVQNNSRYISLVKLKPFIFSILDNKLSDDDILYSDTVFAESYGIHQNVSELSTEEEKKNIEQLEKYRIAIYYKNFKGIFNVTDWKFEEIISYDPKIEVTEDIVKHMKKEVIKFLKTATVAKVPKIKI